MEVLSSMHQNRHLELSAFLQSQQNQIKDKSRFQDLDFCLQVKSYHFQLVNKNLGMLVDLGY